MTTNEREALLLCPFCGGEADYDQMPDDGSHDANKWNIGCVDIHCYAYEFRYRFERKADALKAWNNRTVLNQRQEVTDEMVDLAYKRQQTALLAGLTSRKAMRRALEAILQSVALPAKAEDESAEREDTPVGWIHSYQLKNGGTVQRHSSSEDPSPFDEALGLKFINSVPVFTRQSGDADDAYRYRWLRIRGAAFMNDPKRHLEQGLVMRCNVLDDAIDKAISRKVTLATSLEYKP